MFKKKKSQIENEFQFLADNGFLIKKYLRPPDEEYVFSKDCINIEVSHYLGALSNGKNAMCFCIVLTINERRKNLLECNDVFENDKLLSLKNAIINVPIVKQITLYANFFKNNLQILQ